VSASPSTQTPGTYAVVTDHSASATPLRSGMSHAEAMTMAEMLRREGQIVRIMHVTGDKSCEVDHYPAR
jgi:hypothetical protein